MSHAALTLEEVVDGAVGPFDDYCGGYGNPGSSGVGYVSVLKLSTGMVLKAMDSVLEGIVSYDRAEKNDAYAGQINMIAASSFNGINGAVWGYHLARHDGQPTPRRRRDPGLSGRAAAGSRRTSLRQRRGQTLPTDSRSPRRVRDEGDHDQRTDLGVVGDCAGDRSGPRT
jgi:hypothetical protein